METMIAPGINWEKRTNELGKIFAERAAQFDKDGRFVVENYADLKADRYFSVAIPEELGGDGQSFGQVCHILKDMAHYCASTALSFSMHQHLVAAAVWKYRNKGESGPMLKKVADGQLVLVSTGARDWLDSNGNMERTEGGYMLTAKKYFASQSAAGDIAVTSAPYEDPEKGWQVLHFPVPLSAKGVTLLDDWDVLGMRATGSQTIVFDRVFIPDAAIALVRPRTGYHAVWDIVIGVAMPLIMSVYVGIAEKAMEIAIALGNKYPRNQPHLPYIIGKMNNSLVSAQTQWKAMVANVKNFDFRPGQSSTLEMLSLKSNVAAACISTVDQAMDAVGGQSFYRKNTLERLFRDVQAAKYHPLPEWEQYRFTGERLLQG